MRRRAQGRYGAPSRRGVAGSTFTVALMLVAAVLAGCASFTTSAPPTRTVLVGADLSLHGAGAATGRVLDGALRLQVRSLNDQDAVPHVRFALAVRDNRSDPATSTANIRAFQQDRTVVAAVTGGCDDCLTATAPLIGAGSLPVVSLSPVDLPAGTAGQGSPLFKLAPNAGDDAAALVRLLLGGHTHRAALVAGPGRYAAQVSAAIRQEARSRHLSLADTTRLTGATGTVAGHVLGAGPSSPDAVLVVASPGSAASMVGSLRQQGFRGTVALDAAAVSDLFLSDDRLNGCYLVFPAILAMDDQVASTPAKAVQRQWFDDYTSRYGGYSAVSGFAGDALSVIADAALAAGATDRGKLQAAIETIQFDGLSGPVRFTPDTHSALTPQALSTLRVANRRWHLSTTLR